jgi:transposase-like protein
MEYKGGDKSMAGVAEHYGLTKYLVKSWVNRYSGELAGQQITGVPMTAEEQKELALLKKQLGSLNEQLEYEQMKNFALETMIDLAKEELGVDLRKNSGAKQPGE